jgi:beta-glucosidase
MDFPREFYFGAATSAHQVEGGNRNDWTEWEKENAARLAERAKKREWPDYILKNYPNPLQPENYISGRASDHYNRYEEDFDIAKKLGHNAHRFSIEWSRIEPEEGKWNEKEIEHYRKVIRALRTRNLEPFITLWHWTLPLWLRDKGGVASRKFPKYFSRYAARVVRALGESEKVKYWLTLNEPTSVILNSYLRGVWPPQKKNIFAAFYVFRILAAAHRRAFYAIHKISPSAQVGFANIISCLEPASASPLDRWATFLNDYFSNRYFLKLTGAANDFLALQYYFHRRIKFPNTTANLNQKVSDMGWEIYPEGLYRILKRFRGLDKPIYITENGLADARDAERANFIRQELHWVKQALRKGVDVRGYFYWSLLDNFEWDKGFWPRFGLVEVNYKTMARKIRPSAFVYRDIIKNGLPDDTPK